MSRRYIAVTADIFDHDLFRGQEYSQREAWLWLIANAAWKNHEWRRGNDMVPIKRGQVIAARAHLANVWGWGEKKVRLFLELLESQGMLERGQSKGRFANVLSICNYETFQSGKAIKGPVAGPVEGQLGAGSGPYSTKDTLLTNKNPPTPQGGGVGGAKIEEANLPPASPSKPKRERLNVAPNYTPEFNAVWQAFPTNPNASKQDAFRAWKKIPAAEHAGVLRSVPFYVAEVKENAKGRRDGRLVVCHLSTYLNQGTFRTLLDKHAAKAPTLAADGQTSVPAAGDRWAHLDRLTPPQWQAWLRQHLAGAEFWPIDKVGPCPGATGCRIPASVIESMSLRTLYDPKGVPRNKNDQSHPFRVARAPAPAINGHQHDGAAL
jgi:hypothetical protein